MSKDSIGVYEAIEAAKEIIPKESWSLNLEFFAIRNMMDQERMIGSRLYGYPKQREALLEELFSKDNKVWLKSGEPGTRENVIRMLDEFPPGDYDTDGRHVMENGQPRWLCRLNRTDSPDYPKAVAFGYPSRD